MNEKGFEAEISYETPNYEVSEEKPLKSEKKHSSKVDINVLKARVQEIQNRENKKNILIFISFLIILLALGIFLSA